MDQTLWESSFQSTKMKDHTKSFPRRVLPSEGQMTGHVPAHLVASTMSKDIGQTSKSQQDKKSFSTASNLFHQKVRKLRFNYHFLGSTLVLTLVYYLRAIFMSRSQEVSAKNAMFQSLLFEKLRLITFILANNLICCYSYLQQTQAVKIFVFSQKTLIQSQA